MSEDMLIRCKKAATPTDSKSAIASPTHLTSPRVRDSQPATPPHKAATGTSIIIQNKEDESEHHETPDLSTQLERAKRFGHNLSQVNVGNKSAHQPTPANPISPKMIQCRLKIGRSGDKYEQEADRVAEQVMAMPAPPKPDSIQRQGEEQDEAEALQTKPLAANITPLIQRQPESTEEQDEPEALQTKSQAEKDEEQVQLMPTQQQAAQDSQRSSNLENQLKGSKGGGNPLPDSVRDFVETRIGADFRGVRVHTDSTAVQMNRELNAQAFTHGQDIYFGAGKYEPGSSDGKRLLAHELTHVVQQTGAKQIQRQPVNGLKSNQSTPALSYLPSSVLQLKPNLQPKLGVGKTTLDQKPKTTPAKTQNTQNSAATTPAKPQNAQNPQSGNGNTNPTAGAPSGNGNTNPTAGAPSGNGNTNPTGAEGTRSDREELGLTATLSNLSPAAPNSPDGSGVSADGSSMEAPSDAASTKTADAQSNNNAASPDATGMNPGNAIEQADKGNDGKQSPVSAQEDSAFQSVVEQTKQVAANQQDHAPAETESQQAQDAAQGPANEVESKAQDKQVQEMEQQPPGTFDAAAFKQALMDKIAEATPKNLEEADNFKNNNKIDEVKQEVSSQVTEQQKQAQEPIENKTKEKPNPSGIEPKPVTPLPPKQAGPNPPDVKAAKAAPKPKSPSEVSLQAGSQSIDQKMASAKITDEQLAKSNEPSFQSALEAKKEAQTHANTAPVAYRQQEQGIVSQAQDQAQTMAQKQLEEMHGTREQSLTQVVGLQGTTKGKDEQERAKVANHIQEIYNNTKQKVDTCLGQLDGEVNKLFDDGAAAAQKLFEEYVGKRMDAYKAERYSGFWGPGKWLKDKLFGMPGEVNKFYEEGKQQYLASMGGTIDQIANLVATKLNEAKAEITKGKQEIQNYVTSLPQSLQQVGQEAAENIQGKFDELEQTVNSKQDELIDNLAQKYNDNLQQLNSRIEEMKEENKGLVQKAVDFVVGVAKTIAELAKLLAQALARAASVIPKILADPIGFVNNLVRAVKQGFLNFMKNIGQHLQQGLIGWLTGTMATGGIQMPESLDLKGIFSLVTQVLGFTYEVIRAQAVKRLGEEKVGHLEQNFEIFRILASEGLIGIWQFIQDRIGDLNALVIEPIKNFVIETVIKAGIEWILSLLTPASAFIKACKAIYEIVRFFIERAQQIADLINAILDAISAIASGAIDQAIKGVENALAKSLPVVISFLASLLGLGGISQRIQAIFQKLRKPMEKAVDWIIDKGAKAYKKIGNKFNNSKAGKKFHTVKDSAQEKYKAGKQWVEDKQEAAHNWVNDKKEAAEQWVSDKKGTVKNKFKQSKLGQKFESAKAWGNKKKQAAKSWLEDKRGAAKDKYKKTADKGKEKVAAIVEWWKAKKQFKTEDGETHTLFFKGKGKSAELMVASTLGTLQSFIAKLKNKDKYPRPAGSLQEQALAEIERLAGEIDQIKNNFKHKADNKDTSLPASYSASTGGARIRELFDKIKEQLEIFYKHAGSKDKGLPPTIVEYPTQKRQTIELTNGTKVESEDGEKMVAEPLSINPGGNVGSAPAKGGTDSELVKEVTKRNQNGQQVYVRGHLLNHQVHGSGNNFRNLTPLTHEFNQYMEKEVEARVKTLVLQEKKVLSYKVEVVYGKHAERTHLKAENNLATAIKFELYKMKKEKGKSGKEKGDWKKDTSIYSDTLQHTLPKDEELGTEPTINIGNDSADEMVIKVREETKNERQKKKDRRYENCVLTKENAQKIINKKNEAGEVKESDILNTSGVGKVTLLVLKEVYRKASTSTAASTASMDIDSESSEDPMDIDLEPTVKNNKRLRDSDNSSDTEDEDLKANHKRAKTEKIKS